MTTMKSDATPISGSDDEFPLNTLDILQSEQESTVQPFVWLTKSMMYLPMYTPLLPNEKNKSTSCTAIYMSILVSITLIHGFAISWLSTVMFTPQQSEVQIVKQFMVLCNRIISAYYFYCYFDYMWLDIDMSTALRDRARIRKWSTFTLTCVSVASLLELVYLCIISHQYYSATVWFIPAAVTSMVHYVPVYVSLGVHSAMCSKYYLYLHKLQLDVYNHKPIEDIFKSYYKFQESFDKDDHWALKWSIYLVLAWFLLEIFMNSYTLVDYGDYSIADDVNTMHAVLFVIKLVHTVFIYLLFVMPSSYLNKIFGDFEKKLWEKHAGYMNCDEFQNFGPVLQYIERYPILIKVGRIDVSKMTARRFVVGTIVVKVIMYLIRSQWLEYEA
eukprot:82320_1